MKKRRFLALLLVCVFTMIPFVSNAATNDWKKHTKLYISGHQVYGTQIDSYREYTVIDKGKWCRNKKGWWYQWSDGTYPASEIVSIDEKTYLFTDNGYLYQTGYYDGRWYDGNGVMRHDGWKAAWYKNAFGWWYGKKEDGKLTWYKRNGWLKIDNKWYFFDNRGYILQNAVLQVGEKLYCFNGSGALTFTTGGLYNEGFPDYVYSWYKSEDERTIEFIGNIGHSTGGSSGSGESRNYSVGVNTGSNNNFIGDGFVHNSNENYSFTSN